eukprot:1515982-Amphidinium_carterae.1
MRGICISCRGAPASAADSAAVAQSVAVVQASVAALPHNCSCPARLNCADFAREHQLSSIPYPASLQKEYACKALSHPLEDISVTAALPMETIRIDVDRGDCGGGSKC